MNREYHKGYSIELNREMEFLQALSPADVVRALHARFARYAGRYICDV